MALFDDKSSTGSKSPLLRRKSSMYLEDGNSLSHEDFEYAAWIMQDALEGYNAPKYPRGKEGRTLRQLTDRLYFAKQAYNLVAVVLLVITLIEVPLWCDHQDASQGLWTLEDFWSGDSEWSVAQCPLPDGTAPEMSGMMMIPFTYGIILEMMCMVVATLSLMHEARLYHVAKKTGYEGLRRPGHHLEWLLAILLLMWVDLLFYMRVHQKNFRFAPYGRVLMLLYWPRVRSVFSSAWNCLEEFGNVTLFLLGTVLFYAWFMMLVVNSLSKDEPSSTWESVGGDNFSSFGSALISFFEMSTGADYPDRMLYMLRKMRWTGVIFFPFMILTYFLFTQLMLAVVYEEYQVSMKAELTTFYTQRVIGLEQVYSTLAIDKSTGSKRMSLEVFEVLTWTLSKLPGRTTATKVDADLLFEALDDGTRTLGLDDFYDACDFLELRFWTTPDKSLFVRKCGMSFQSVENFIDSGGLDHVMNWTLVMNAAFIALESWLDVKQIKYPWWVKILEIFFSVVYMGDVGLKLLVMSFSNYWSTWQNQFDFFVSVTLFLTGVVSQVPSVGNYFSRALPFLGLLRILRLLRLLAKLLRFKVMAKCIANLVRVSMDMVLLLFISSLSFGIVGTQAYGGLLYPTNPQLQGSAYLASGYDVLNFNDMTEATMSLFSMMVCGFMPEYADAMNRVGPFNLIGWIYCICFFLGCVNISFNIFTAFTIDIFVAIKKGGENSMWSERYMQSMQALVKEQGLALHFVVPTAVMKEKLVMDVIDDLENIVRNAKDGAVRRMSSKNRRVNSLKHDAFGSPKNSPKNVWGNGTNAAEGGNQTLLQSGVNLGSAADNEVQRLSFENEQLRARIERAESVIRSERRAVAVVKSRLQNKVSELEKLMVELTRDSTGCQ